MNWQDIKSAPKDTEILLFTTDKKHIVGSWLEAAECWKDAGAHGDGCLHHATHWAELESPTGAEPAASKKKMPKKKAKAEPETVEAG